MGEPDPRRLAQALLLRSALASGDVDPSAETLAGELESLARGTQPPAGGPRATEVDRRFCAALGTLLTRRGPDVHDHLAGLAVYHPPVDTGLTHACGCGMAAVLVVLPALRGPGRTIHICDRCGIVGDVAAGRPVPVATPGPAGGLRISLPAGRLGWCCAGRQPVGGTAEVPTAVRFAPGRTVDLGAWLRGGTGLRRWAVAVVSDGDYAVVQLPVRGDGTFGGAGRA